MSIFNVVLFLISLLITRQCSTSSHKITVVDIQKIAFYSTFTDSTNYCKAINDIHTKLMMYLVYIVA